MSQKTEHSRTIDGKTYVVLMLPPLEAHDVLMDLTKTVLPSFGNLLASFVGSPAGGGEEPGGAASSFWDLIEQVSDREQMAEAFHALARSLDKEQVRALMRRMAELTRVQMGERQPTLSDVFDAHFQGRIMSMYRWLAYALEVNFGDFFGSLASDTGLSARLPVKDRSTSPSASEAA